MSQPSQPVVHFGEPLARIHAKSNRNPRFALGSLGGRWVLMCVAVTLDDDAAVAALAAFAQHKFESPRVGAVFVGEPGDNELLHDIARSELVFTDKEALRRCGLADGGKGRWILFDPSLRVAASWPLSDSAAAINALHRTPSPDQHAGAPLNAPVLIAPRVFEPEFCRALINHYAQHGGEPSGVTKQSDSGKAFVALDDAFKRRSDCLIRDASLREAVMQRIYWRLAPEIEKAFMWRPTRMERYLVARYAADGGGFFKPHRDNTTAGTAHRRFAVTINLNAEAYEGGDLRFPEFGSRTYRAPTGGAVVFSCALLHEATPVSQGERYAFLPFLYDEEAAKLRLANNQHLDASISPYES